MTKRALVLVEGYTERQFVKDVLAPLFSALDLYLYPTLLVTKRVKHGPNFKGGVTTYQKFRNDAQRLLHEAGGALVTTLVDYYGLPSDFPGMATRPGRTALERVTHVEEAIRKDLGSPRDFIPFLALHEFEAWLFASPEELPRTMTAMEREGKRFKEICGSVSSPEEIDEGPTTAPSKRILEIFPSYRKALHGPLTVMRIGVDRIQAACPHMDSWVRALEAFARGDRH